MESNIIIIAACIPTLAPLLDMVLGRKVLGSSSGGRYHSSQYGKRSGHIRTSSYELGSEKRSVARDTVRETEGSQESILPGDEISGNAIQRRDDVVVEYEDRRSENNDGSSKWRKDF